MMPITKARPTKIAIAGFGAAGISMSMAVAMVIFLPF